MSTKVGLIKLTSGKQSYFLWPTIERTERKLYLRSRDTKPTTTILEVTTILASKSPGNIRDIRKSNSVCKEILKAEFFKGKWPTSPEKLYAAIMDRFPYAVMAIAEKRYAFKLLLSGKLFEKTKSSRLKPLELYQAVATNVDTVKYQGPPTITIGTDGPHKRKNYSTFHDYFETLWQRFMRREHDTLISLSQYLRLFSASQSIEWELKKKPHITNHRLKLANNILHDLPERTNPLVDFALLFLNSYLCSLNEKRFATCCRVCGNLFVFKDRKRYCSARCRRRAQNKKYYNKYKSRLLPIKRAYMQEYHKL